ncbi:hypothetical protein KEM54_003830 [Ascosphaera aggregata]|nr:hypothetical protein KEM54_003830 [Ascosphaera aggregata]
MRRQVSRLGRSTATYSVRTPGAGCMGCAGESPSRKFQIACRMRANDFGRTSNLLCHQSRQFTATIAVHKESQPAPKRSELMVKGVNESGVEKAEEKEKEIPDANIRLLLGSDEEDQCRVQEDEARQRLQGIRPYKASVEAMDINFTYRPLWCRPRQTSHGTDSAGPQRMNDNDKRTHQATERNTTLLKGVNEQEYEQLTEEDICNRQDNWSYSNMIDYRNLLRFYKSTLNEDDAQKAVDLVLSNPDREICRDRAKRNVDPFFWIDKVSHAGVADIWRMLRDDDSTNDQIWTVYRNLPIPGVAFLGEKSRGLLLHRFAKPRRRCRADCLRYLALVDDMTEAGLHLSDSLWNSAIFLASKYSTNIGPKDLEQSLGLWRRMEYQGHVRSGRVSFNILFDIAVKAGQYKVAEKIMDEMISRGLNFSRNGKVTKIYLQGQLRNPDGVREAYNEFVASGELVDTVVLNCVMVSLLKAGEFNMAEKIYDRMKDIHDCSKHSDSENETPKLYPSPSDNYIAYRRASERLGSILGATSYLKQKLPEAHDALQAALPLTPDARTYHILLSHHGIRTGNFKRFVELIQDMKKTFEIAPQGMIFLFLFQGFAIHGGVPGTEWTLKRLRKAWSAFIQALDDPRNNSWVMREERERTRQRIAKLTCDLEAQGGKLTETAAERATARASARADGSMMAKQFNGDRITTDFDETSENTPPITRSAAAPAPAPTRAEEVLSSNMRNRLVLESTVVDEWRTENTVYLGRAIIIAVLNAFRTCGSIEDLCDTWEAIDVRWRMNEQRTRDVFAVKAELRRLLRGR